MIENWRQKIKLSFKRLWILKENIQDYTSMTSYSLYESVHSADTFTRWGNERHQKWEMKQR